MESELQVLMFAICEGVHIDSVTMRRSLFGLYDGEDPILLTPYLQSVHVVVDITGVTSHCVVSLSVTRERDAFPVPTYPSGERILEPGSLLDLHRPHWLVAGPDLLEEGEYRFELRVGDTVMTRLKPVAVHRGPTDDDGDE